MQRNLVTTIAVLACLIAAVPAFGQNTNQITAISPDTADPGTTALLVNFTLDSDLPPPPPAGILPDSATIGTLAGTAISHPSQYSVTALFDIPGDEVSGARNASVVFTTPNGTLTFSMAGGFTVNTAPDTPPAITEHPSAQIVRVGDPVVFAVSASGTEPLLYQWQRDDVDLPGATLSTHAIASVGTGDAGDYLCIVTNDFGSDPSAAAELTVDTSVPLVAAPYPVVDTAQIECYDDANGIPCPDPGEAYHAQDSQCDGYQSRFSVSGDGLTVHDETTGLIWQRSSDTDGDGTIDADDKLTLVEAQAYPATLNASVFGGYDDWRLPSIKDLYSLMDFRGGDPSSYSGSDASELTPFIDTDYFEFGYGDTGAGERLIDAQFVTSTEYLSTTMGGNATVFGVNFADGRIKGYPQTNKTFYALFVRGNLQHGSNEFVDSGDGTILDLATGLIWQQADSVVSLDWDEALTYAEDLTLAGYTDWRLPNAKELQSIVDYTRSPDTHGTAAIDPLFTVTSITSEAGQTDFPCYWSGTTHATWDGGGGWGSYVAFGRALGYWQSVWQDVHGAGAQRSDPKTGDPGDYPEGHGPQGDAVRVYNHVRAVRGGNGPLYAGIVASPPTPTDLTPVTLTAAASGGTSPFTYSWDLAGAPAAGEIVVREFSAGTHSVSLTVTDAAGLVTFVSQEVTIANSPLPPVADGGVAGEGARFTRNPLAPDRIDVSYGTTPCSGSEAVILYGNLGDFSSYAGSAQDHAGSDGVATIDAAALENVWFNIVWTSGTTAGHPGFGAQGESPVERAWSAAGLAGLTDDDHSDATCD